MTSILSHILAWTVGPAVDRRSGRRHTMIRSGAWVLGLAVVLVALTVWDLRGIVLADALLNTENLAIVLAEQTGRSVQAVDIVLRTIQDRIVAAGVTTPDQFRRLLGTQAMHEYLKGRLESLPQVDNLALVDAMGIRVNYSLGWPVPPGDMSDREYTHHFKALNDQNLFISEPVVNRATFVWSTYLVRRVNGPHGEFLGMILASAPLSGFADLYRTINLPHGEAFLLARRDGTMLVRHPDAAVRTGTKMPAGSPWYDQVEKGGGHYDSSGVFDRMQWIVAVRPLRDYPLVMDVAISRDEALAHWRREAALIGTGTAITAVCLLLLLLALQRQFGRLEESRAILALRNTDLVVAAGALRASEARVAATSQELQITLASMDQGLLMVDALGQVAVCNRRATEMLGLPPVMMASRPALGAVPSLQWLAHDRACTGDGRPTSQERVLANGLIVEVACVPLADGDGWVATVQDITARRHAEQQVAFMAHYDALTGLPNRILFRDRIEQAIAQSGRGIPAAVLCLDLDHFKAVNDTLGHPVGDQLLRSVGDRLSACVRQVDVAARSGGDEFAVVQVGPERVEDVAILAQRIIDTLSAPYEIDGHQVIVGVSVGIALVPADGSNPDTLLKNAEIALYRAKADGRGTFRLFEPAMDAQLQERRTLELDLRRALVAEEFVLYYQPLIDVASGRLCGFEALMRWEHPTRGLLGPGLFIPLAEELGLIVPLGRWALQVACIEAMGWPDDVRVAVNLSAVQFGSRELVRWVAEALGVSGLEPRRLNLEITESVLLQNTEEVLGILHELRGLGPSISMDDFGTGYSSLSYLRRFPFDKIKIDQSFVRDLPHSRDAAAIVRAITSLGHSLGMATTAEGVETQAQLARLSAEGCTEVQGYLFSRPVPANEVSRLLWAFHRDRLAVG